MVLFLWFWVMGFGSMFNVYFSGLVVGELKDVFFFFCWIMVFIYCDVG